MNEPNSYIKLFSCNGRQKPVDLSEELDGSIGKQLMMVLTSKKKIIK